MQSQRQCQKTTFCPLLSILFHSIHTILNYLHQNSQSFLIWFIHKFRMQYKVCCRQIIRYRISYTTAILSNAFTSGSCGCASNGSHRKIIKSICPSTILAPICWSPPNGPLQYPFTGSPVFSEINFAVVPCSF